METKTITFQTGVDITVDLDKITAQDDSGADKMDSENFDSLSYTEVVEPKISPSGLSTIPFIIGLILVIVGSGDKSPIFIIGAILMGISVLAFIYTFIDSMLEIGAARRLIAKYWANKGYAVKIGNKSGNNIELYAELDELPTIKELEKVLSEMKSQLKNQKQNNSPHQSTTTNLDELKKLGELLNAGILTQDEFDRKKNELLKS